MSMEQMMPVWGTCNEAYEDGRRSGWNDALEMAAKLIESYSDNRMTTVGSEMVDALRALKRKR